MKHAIGLIALVAAGITNIATSTHEPIRAIIITILVSTAVWLYDDLVLDHMDTEDDLEHLKQYTKGLEKRIKAKIPKEG